jgi:hypothetical protein
MKWSSLRSAVDSPLATVAILLSLFGFDLLFNDAVIDALSLAPEVARQVALRPSSPEGSQAALREATIERLYFVYFGVALFGVGAILFRALCPALVRSYLSAQDRYGREQDFPTVPRVQNAVRHLTAVFMKNAASSWGRRRQKAVAVLELLPEIEHGDHDVYFPMGALNPDSFASGWISERTRDGQWRNPEQMRNYAFTAALLEYEVADESWPAMRTVITLLVGAGLLIMLVPTAQVLARLGELAIARLAS